MTYLERYDLAVQGGEFRNRVKCAIADVLPDIYNEVDTTPLHTERVAWCEHALGNLDRVTSQMMWLVVSHSLVDTNGIAITDADLKIVVSANVNIAATLYYGNLQAGTV